MQSARKWRMIFLKNNELSSNSWWNQEKQVWKSGLLNNVYGEVTMKNSAVYDYIQRFRDGWEDMNDDPGCSWHIETRTPSNVECVKQLLDSNHHLSIRDVAGQPSINHKTVYLIVKDKLHLRKLRVKLIPKNLTKEQKKRQVDVWRDWLEATESENIL